MATMNVGILTTAGKTLLDRVESGQTKITYSKMVFSSMDSSSFSDAQLLSLTLITPQEVVINSPQAMLDRNNGETKIRGNGDNSALSSGVYIKTYGVYAKDDDGNEILYGLTVSDHPNYLAPFDGLTPQAVTYTYKTTISRTDQVNFTNSADIYLTDQDLKDAVSVLVTETDFTAAINAKQDKLNYTAADDSKVVHLSGANNFDTVPTVNNNPLLLASSLPSDLARTGQDQEFTGKNTFDVAPIDKTTGNPYITKDGVPAVPSTLADTTKPANFTDGLQKSGKDVATTADVTTAISTANSALSAINGLKAGTNADGADLNNYNYNTFGNYYSSTAVTNGPFGTEAYVAWSVFPTDNTIIQVACKQDGRTATRMYWNGSGWGAWTLHQVFLQASSEADAIAKSKADSNNLYYTVE
ncbi:hypothetical protein [Lactiplantibacillus daowaiensis]|uniref:Tail fiber protein n=1 Tax=Lactiplantibacillus daowaiensis TaxID=2559918 RepID=A0ABW1RXC1_9LACO|nr:hypothetical protein [Lactiplantibacillus daowaiensis]